MNPFFRWCTALVGVCVLSPLASAQNCIPPPPSMEAWWALDETAGSTAQDYTGFFGAGNVFNNGATLPGALGSAGSPLPVPGMVAGAYSFLGTSASVVAPPDPTLDFGTGDFSADGWVWLDQPLDLPPITAKFGPGAAGTNVGYEWMLVRAPVSGQYQMRVNLAGPSGGQMQTSPPFPAPLLTWFSVAFTVDRTAATTTFYANGVPVGTAPITITGSVTNSAPQLIADVVSTPFFLPGRLDELELFRRVLTPGEVASLHAIGTGGKCRPIGVGAEGAPDPPAQRFATVAPNPTGGRATIRYTLDALAPVRIVVHDATGRVMARLVHAVQAEGPHEVAVRTGAWPQGRYVVVVQAGLRREVLTLAVVR